MNRTELKEYKDRLLALRARMAGDVNQLRENSLRKSRSEANGDLSSMPIHMADIGSDNYEQEFSLSLMENEGVALAKIQILARKDRRRHLRRLRGMRRQDSQDAAERDPLRELVHQVRFAA